MWLVKDVLIKNVEDFVGSLATQGLSLCCPGANLKVQNSMSAVFLIYWR